MEFLGRCKPAIIGFVVLLLAATAAIAWVFYGSLPDYKGHAEIRGLNSKVDVYRDSHGVPHIFAGNRADALRALGYLHASERLFQMEMQRRAGQGRLSEAIGPDMLGVDTFIRTLGLYALAESGYAAMAPESQKLFQAYADGVNAWIGSHPHNLPPEFLLLGITPQPWKPADSVVWGKLMGLQLSHNYKLEVLRAQLAPKLSAQQMKTLFPAWNNAPITMEPRLAKTSGATTADSPEEKLGALIGLDHPASNEWVISGSRTQSGKPILANDPHLSLEAPILWYLARIVTPDFAVKGATVPGLPVVLLGQNANIAWGMTTTGSDVEDLFVETVDPKNPGHYLTPQGSVAFDIRKEQIKVKGAEDAIVTIRATRHGPVMSDLDPAMAAAAGDGKVMALAFTGLGAHDRSAESLLLVNAAQNWRQFQDAFRFYQTPTQNIVFADIKGDIGFINPGLVPIRKKGDGMMPADGASGAYDWTGTIPFEEWPRLYNPPAGFVFNANNALAAGNDVGGRYYGADWEEPYRALRLQHYFDTIDQHTLDSSAAMQGDHVSLAARQLLPYLLRLKFDGGDNADPRAAEAVDMLRDWDGTMDKNRPEPLMFEAWLYQMHKLLLEGIAKQPLLERGPFAANSIALILSKKDNGWCAEDVCAAYARQAMTTALDWLTARQGADMKSWKWGKEHVALLQNKLFKHVPLLSGVSDLSIASSGDFYTLDRGGSFDAPKDMPFARQHGGGYRAIYDLANPDRSRFMITTGESGHILSPHYGDLVTMWNEVKAITLSGSQAEMAQQNSPLLELTP